MIREKIKYNFPFSGLQSVRTKISDGKIDTKNHNKRKVPDGLLSEILESNVSFNILKEYRVTKDIRIQKSNFFSKTLKFWADIKTKISVPKVIAAR